MPERKKPWNVRIARTDRLSASMVRVVVAGEELRDFDPIHADSYVKVLFPEPDGDPDRPRRRTYTVRAFDRDKLELTLDFVVHGDAGLAGPWAATAAAGDEVELLGPGGGYSPSPEADWHLLAGDESALPAIAVALERMPAGVPVQAFVEVHGPEDEIDIDVPDGARLEWLHRGTGAVGSRLVEEVRNWPMPTGAGQLFVHGEAGFVKTLRGYLRMECGIPMERLSISGYWRLGVDDEAWRRVKRDWNREVEESEQAITVNAAS